MHVLIVDDHQDIVENLERKFALNYDNATIATKTDCDAAFDYIKLNKVLNPIQLLVLDLTFLNNTPNVFIKDGYALLQKIKEASIILKTIIYTSHDTIYHIHPIMENFAPQAYVIKTHNSNSTLLYATSKVLQDETYYDAKVIEARFTRIGYEKKLDSIDKTILDNLPNIEYITDWDGVIFKKDGTPMSYNSIKLRLKKMQFKFNVLTEAQLLLKLQKAGLL